MFEDLADDRANHVCDLTLKNTRPIFCKMAATATMLENEEIFGACPAVIVASLGAATLLSVKKKRKHSIYGLNRLDNLHSMHSGSTCHAAVNESTACLTHSTGMARRLMSD
jgi:hypothetical protein